jgi:hypothetical protein
VLDVSDRCGVVARMGPMWRQLCRGDSRTSHILYTVYVLCDSQQKAEKSSELDLSLGDVCIAAQPHLQTYLAFAQSSEWVLTLAHMLI